MIFCSHGNSIWFFPMTHPSLNYRGKPQWPSTIYIQEYNLQQIHIIGKKKKKKKGPILFQLINFNEITRNQSPIKNTHQKSFNHESDNSTNTQSTKIKEPR